MLILPLILDVVFEGKLKENGIQSERNKLANSWVTNLTSIKRPQCLATTRKTKQNDSDYANIIVKHVDMRKSDCNKNNIRVIIN